MANPRNTAFEILYKVEKEDAYSTLLLQKSIRESKMEKLDAAFVSALVYGVLERRLTLDHILEQYSKIPLRKIEIKTRILLRMGLYQLCFMDKVPDSAAVNESVKLAKKQRRMQSAGFINAVLRNFARADKKYTLPDKKNTLEYLSVFYSCPKEIVSLWLDAYGEEVTEKLLKTLFGRPPLTIRVNTLKTTAEALEQELTVQGIKVSRVPFLKTALQVEHTGALEQLPAFQEGKFFVQDASSQLCVHFLDPQPGETAADVCAAPGGKAMGIAIQMRNRGSVSAFDLHEHKMHLIQNTARRLGISIVQAQVRDAAAQAFADPFANRVLCDVPCSGLGILRRKPEIRYKKDTILNSLPQLQYKILCNSAAGVTTGGVLVYSTCTLNPRENTQVARQFLREHKDFEALPLTLPAGITRGIRENPNEITFFPYITGTDGFFISVFRKCR